MHKKTETVQLTPQEFSEVRKVVIAFIECEECESGEQEALLKLGTKAVPTLISILDGGPSPAKLMEYEQHLRATYNNLQIYAQQHPEGKIQMTLEEYVRTYLDNYIAQYRIRAATGLSAIGGDSPREALEKAAKRTDLRQDVLKQINELLAKMK